MRNDELNLHKLFTSEAFRGEIYDSFEAKGTPDVVEVAVRFILGFETAGLATCIGLLTALSTPFM